MGIKNLNLLLKKKCTITTGNIKNLPQISVAIDFSNWLYKILYDIKKHNRHSKYYLCALYHLSNQLINNNITPIFVFDGKPPDDKMDEINKRQQKRENTNNKIQELLNNINVDIRPFIKSEIDNFLVVDDNVPLDENTLNTILMINKLSRQCLSPTTHHFTNSKRLLQYMGVPYLQADGETDSLCGWLYKKGIIQACISEDMDFLAYGVGRLWRDYNVYSGAYTDYNLTTILSELNINYEKFVMMCTLCGNDYVDIKNLGVCQSYELILQYNHIEDIFNVLIEKNKKRKNKFIIPSNVDYDYIISRFINNDDINIDLSSNKLTLKNMNDNEKIKLIKLIQKYSTSS